MSTPGTRECPSCACEVAENENRCPICRYEFPARPRDHQRWLALIGITLAALLLLMGLRLI
jgi:hypothetical protein